MGKLNPKSLTINYKDLLKSTSIAERAELTKSRTGQELLSSLTPTEVGNLFPDYYKRMHPDVSGFLAAKKSNPTSQATPTTVQRITPNNTQPTESPNNTPVNRAPMATTQATSPQQNRQIILDELNKSNIKDPQMRAAIAAVIQGESGFNPRSEVSYATTSNDRIRSIFKSQLGNISDGELTNLKANPEAFFNKVYGNRLGNAGNEGFMFRGRGYFQLTGRGNYERYGKMIGVDLIGNPDLANDPVIAAKIAIAYIQDRYPKQQKGSVYENVARAVGNPVGSTEAVKIKAYNDFVASGEFAPTRTADVSFLQNNPRSIQQMQGSRFTIVTGVHSHDETIKQNQTTGATFVRMNDIKGIADRIAAGDKVSLFSGAIQGSQNIIADLKARGLSDDQIKNLFSTNVSIVQPHHSADARIRGLVDTGYIKSSNIVVGNSQAVGSNLTNIPGVVQRNEDHINAAGYFARQQQQNTQQITQVPTNRGEAQQIIANIAQNPDLLKQYQSRVIDQALKLEGLHERRDREVLQQYLSTQGNIASRISLDPSQTPWCAAFVNATLHKQGIRPLEGEGSLLAVNYRKWGEAKQQAELAAGDVLVKSGHVGFATGETKTVNGEVYYRMLGGNQADETRQPTVVSRQWVRASDYQIRRARPEDYRPETLAEIQKQQNPNGVPGPLPQQIATHANTATQIQQMQGAPQPQPQANTTSTATTINVPHMQSGGTISDDVQAVPLGREVGPGKEDTALINSKGRIEALTRSDEPMESSVHQGDTSNRIIPKTRTRAEEIRGVNKEEALKELQDEHKEQQVRTQPAAGTEREAYTSNMDKIKGEIAVATGYTATDAMNRMQSRIRMKKVPGDYHYDTGSANEV